MSEDRRVGGVILAAGRSSRLGRPKQLLEIRNQPLLQHVVDLAEASDLDQIVLVLGYHHDEIRKSLRSGRTTSVVNPEYLIGQSSSLRCGIEALVPEIEAALILLGDQPTVDGNLIDTMIREFRNDPPLIIQPAYNGIPGHPVLFDRALFGEILAVTGDEGARTVIQQHRDDRQLIPMPGTSPPDVDTESDYQALLTRFD